MGAAAVDWGLAAEQVAATPEDLHNLIGVAEVQRILRCSPMDIHAIIQTPLSLGNDQFDQWDIWNLGLYSRTRLSQPELEIRLLDRALHKLDGLEEIFVNGVIVAKCPYGTACDGGVWVPPEYEAMTVCELEVSFLGEHRWNISGMLRGRPNQIMSSDILAIWEASKEIRFHFIPHHLEDVFSTRERMVGNCRALSRVLAKDLRNIGIVADVCQGVVWGPFSVHEHAWVDIEDIDGNRKTLDPSVGTMTGIQMQNPTSSYLLGTRASRLIQSRDNCVQAMHTCKMYSGLCDTEISVDRRIFEREIS